MKCLRCKSIRMLKFVDGFGKRRIFCRSCGRSFLEATFIRAREQKSLVDFNFDASLYYNPGWKA